MRIVLVNPPRTMDEVDEIAPPLGLLWLAHAVAESGASVALEDLNLLYHLLPELQEDFYRVAVDRLQKLDADVYGFTSMAVDSHVALELARRLKNSNPHCSVVLGGPHFSSIRELIRSRYPWIDAVAAGGSEPPLSDLLRSADFPAERQLRQPAMAPYSLVQLAAYFHVNPHRVFNYEPNRGCRYRCSFCYSPPFYKAVHNVEVDRVIQDLASIRDLGARRLFFVGDNFINDKSWAARLCDALASAKLNLDWYCYATLPDLTAPLAKQMGRAGCSQVFLGIDAIGRKSQRQFRKAFTRSEDDLVSKIHMLRDNGIKNPTCGFILAPPSHQTGDDCAATVNAALQARRAGADVLINVLNIYPGTDAFRTTAGHYEADFLQAQLLLDVPPVVQTNPYAEEAPSAFPFHSRYVPKEEWSIFLNFAHSLHTLINSFPEELAALNDEGGMTTIEMAKHVMGRVGDLLQLPPKSRRDAEQHVGLTAIQKGTNRTRDLGNGTGVRLGNPGQGFW